MTNLAERIRHQARRAYEAEGPQAVSARKIADQLGVSAMAMYRHYRSKDELLAAVVEEGFEALTARIRKVDRIRNPVRRLEARALQWLEFALEHPRLFDLMFSLPRADARKYPEDFRAQKSPTGVLIEADIREAMLEGLIAEGDALELGMLLWGQMHGLIVLYLGGRINLGDRELKAFFRRSIRRVLMSEPVLERS